MPAPTTFLLPLGLLALLLAAPAFAAEPATAPTPRERWTKEQAADLWATQPWPCGFNYFPATAINSTEMWQASTFDPTTADREFALAQKTGFNCARVLVQYLVWEDDPDGLKHRMDQFLGIADRHGIKVMFVLFDDCYFGRQGPEPHLGVQPAVIPGEYANGFTSSPGQDRAVDRQYWPKLEAYVKDLTSTFRADPRVLAWDLYNEPTNGGMGHKSLPLVEATFQWARTSGTSQPLTVGVWNEDKDYNKLALENSDIITFHQYAKGEDMEKIIAELKQHGRPMICTEWLNRPLGSTVLAVLPVLAKHDVGAMHWGFVNGKTQTQYPWGSKAGSPPPVVWQHDLYHPDMTMYDPKEMELFRETIAASKAGRPASRAGE